VRERQHPQPALAVSVIAFLSQATNSNPEMTLEFLNVDLDIKASRAISGLLVALEKDVVFLQRLTNAATVELRSQPRDPSQAILRFAAIVARLPPKARAQWNRCQHRSMNIGLKIIGTEKRTKLELEFPAIQALISIESSVAFTLYGDAEGPPTA
jgi:hypothetical protein